MQNLYDLKTYMGGKEKNTVSPLVTQLTYAVTLPVKKSLWVPAEICPFQKSSVVARGVLAR